MSAARRQMIHDRVYQLLIKAAHDKDMTFQQWIKERPTSVIIGTTVDVTVTAIHEMFVVKDNE